MSDTLRVLHLVPNSRAFVPFVAHTFASAGGSQNRFVMTREAMGGLSVENEMADIHRQVDSSYFSSGSMRDDLNWCDALIVHYLTPLAARMILRCPSRVAVVWSGWGGDYAHLMAGGRDCWLTKETHELVRAAASSELVKAGASRNLLRPIRACLRPIRVWWLKLARRKRLLKAISRVNFFSSPIPEDYESLRKSLGTGTFSAEYTQLNYVSYEQSFWVPDCFCTGGGNVLVGNSAFPSNNHVDVFRVLSCLRLGSKKIITPLSYGHDSYRKALLAKGRELLGRNFVPIVELLPLAEYNKLLAGCSAAFMNHQIQQAIGNIGVLLHAGARVYFSAQSPVFRFLKQNGAIVFTMDDIHGSDQDVLARLSGEDRETNRSVLRAVWGDSVVLENVRRAQRRVSQWLTQV